MSDTILQKLLPGVPAANLSTARFGDRTGGDDHDHLDTNPAHSQDLLADRTYHRPVVYLLHLVGFHLRDAHDRLQIVVAIDGEDSSTTGSNVLVGDLHRVLQVVAKVVAAADDDHVLNSPRYKKLALVKKTAVTRPQELQTQSWIGASGSESRAERVLRGVRLVVITRTLTRTGDPDLSHIPDRTDLPGIGVNDCDDAPHWSTIPDEG
mmetsp:Transcript_11601/g.32587  ORF Transcript_11601/g.32587 Transcript_11601/m.32587 type:complete len:208 (-) Transcript_11601:485-1108(-)